MIRNSQQCWAVGETVKVGFLRLRVCAPFATSGVPTPGNHQPDQYALTDRQGRFYRFIPHHGLTRVASLAEAMAW
jgi:hypothetical protein